MNRCIVLLVFLTLLVPGCLSKDRKICNLKIAHGLTSDHPIHQAMIYLAKRALEKSDSTLIIDIYPSEQLGNEKDCIEQLQFGILSMTKVSSSPLESFVPKMKVFALPFLFRNAEHKWKVLNGHIGRELLLACEPKGVRGLCYYDAGARSFYTKSKPILRPDDLKGLKIRTQQSPMAIEIIKVLGGSPTPISWGELYTALQQGVVDGAENNPPSFHLSRHYEVCKYYALNEHTAVPDVIIISTVVWNSLTEEERNILRQAAREAEELQKKIWKEATEEALRI